MVQLDTVEAQLKACGANIRFFGRPEVRELTKILAPNEIIAQAVNGYYEGGFALLCLTNQRLLLVDRKPMFLTLEDIRFDMVSEVDFNYRMLNSMMKVYTPNKSLVFSTWNHKRLRELSEYLQHHVMQSRQQQQYLTHEQFAQFAQAQLPQKPQVPQSRQLPMSLLPALAGMAIRSTNQLSEPGLPLTRFVSPLSRNPYTKTPLLSRRRKVPRF